MGADSQPPYLYDRPSEPRIAYPYSQFNPKAVTQAEAENAKRRSQQSQKPKQEGPLINFNQHPDSYMIVHGVQPDFKPLPKNTKKAVKVVRWVQFTHRIINEIAALGLLVCAIVIRGMAGAERWLVTIPPAWDALITLYGVYHLVRPAKARTPSSSASYHFFALIMDAGLIPLYVIIALFAHNNSILPTGADGRWRTFFADEPTNLVLQVTFLGAIALGALHLVCAGIDLYLIIIFRKIATLPPDMNPLEDNLTRRKSIRSHKYKDSNASALTGSAIDVSDKHPNFLSGSTLSVDNQSRYSLLKDGTEVRQMEFRHSRNNSDYSFSPHNPQSAKLSKQAYDEAHSLYQQNCARNSAQDFNRYSRAGSASPSKRGTMIDTLELPGPPSPARDGSPRPGSFATARSNRTDSPQRYQHGNNKSVSSLHLPAASNVAESQELVRSQQSQGLLNDNWYVFDGDDDASDLGVASPKRQERYVDSPSTSRNAVVDRVDSFEPMQAPPKPLGMHPPSPATQAKFSPHERHDSGFEAQQTTPTARSRTDTTHSRANSSEPHQLQVARMYQAQQFQREREQANRVQYDRHDSFVPAVQTPGKQQRGQSQPLLTRDPPTPPPVHEQTRLMRDLTPEPEDDDDATLRGRDTDKLGVSRSDTSATASSSVYSESAPSLMSANGQPKSVGTPKGKYYGDLSAAMAAVRGNSPVRGAPNAGPGDSAGKGSPYYHGYGLPPTPQASRTPSPPKKNPNRVISRTGVDIADAMLYGQNATRRREVSGKVVEEGRGGRW